MQFIDLSTQQVRISDRLRENVEQVFAHGKYINGPEVGELEHELSKYVGVDHAVGCSSGTDALLLALIERGIGPGDAVFTTPFTFIATAEVICLLGATPIFVDIDPDTFNISPEQLSSAIDALAERDRSKYPLPKSIDLSGLTPKGVIAVDLFGLVADYDAISSIASSHRLLLIEDAAQSFGAMYNGERAGSLGDVACTSFFPAKPLGCYGDGGMCFTRDADLSERLRSLTVHGKGAHKYDNVRIGINGRLDTLQAAILLAKFEIFPDELDARHAAATTYGEFLAEIEQLQVPTSPAGHRSAWAQYSVLAPNEGWRSAFQAALKSEGIPTAVYYPRPLHQQTAFAHLGYSDGDFPVSEDHSRRVFSLPMHPYLDRADQERIATILKSVSCD